MLGTQESAAAGGHHLKSIGVTWTDHAEAAALRDTLAARGIEDVMLVSDTHAAAALAQAVGRAIGYDTTALLFIEKDTATLSVVQTDDGSVVKVLSRDLHNDDAMAVLTEMAAAVDAQESPPQGMFVVGSGVDVSSVKAHLENLVGPARQRARRTRTRAGPRRGAGFGERACFGGDHRRPGLLAGSRRNHSGQRVCGTGRLRPRRWRRWAVNVDELRGADRHRADCCRGGPQAVPARRQRVDVDLRGWRCRTGDFAGCEHPADGRSAAESRPERDRAQHGGTRPGTCAGSTAARRSRSASSTGGDHQAASARRRAGSACARAQQAPRQVFVEQAPAPQAPAPAPAPEAPPPAPEAPPAPAPIAPAPVPYIPAPVYNPPVYNPYQPPPGYYPRPNPWQQYPEPYDPPQGPQYPGEGGSGGHGDYPGPGSYPGGYGGRGGGCFLIFCRR